MSEKEKLFDKFPPVTTQAWLDKINTDLKGADFNKKMIWKTNEGFAVKPFYRSEDLKDLRAIESLPGEFPYMRGTKKAGNQWNIRQNIEVSNYALSNHKAHDLISKGVTSLGFIIADPESVNLQNFEILLKDLQFENTEINILCNGKALEIIDSLKTILNKKGIDLNLLKGALEVFPLGRLMLNGKLCIKIGDGLNYLSNVVKNGEALKNFRVIQVNGSDYTNAGADCVTELAFSLSMGNEYLAGMVERGIDPKDVASKIRFAFGTGSNYFMEIAKLRAARLLWSVIVNRYSEDAGEASKMKIHCVTGEWNKTVYDPHINLLRTQTEAMSAVLGGADSLTVEPFDIVFRSPGDFSERIARNQQIILKEEVHLDVIADPAAGSYYIENLTSLISEAAWKLFIEVEEKGGFLKALQAGFIQNKVKEIADKRKKDVNLRKESFVGTNQYPNMGEKVSLEIESSLKVNSTTENDFEVEPLHFFRATEEIERLRMNVDKAGKRPVVFLFTVGNAVMKKARAQFSANFFGCGGYRVVENSDFATFEEGIDAAAELRPEIIVVCSSDEEYAEYAPLIYDRFREKSIIIVAGAPPGIEELKNRGIQHFISIRSDLYATLKEFNTLLGI